MNHLVNNAFVKLRIWVSPTIVLPILAAALFLWFWDSAAASQPTYLLPSPGEVKAAYSANQALIHESLYWTGYASVFGLLVSLVIATVLSILFVQFRWMEFALYPYAVLLQTIPIIIIAPMLVVWLDYGMAISKTTATVVCFFPLLTSIHMGLSATPKEGLALFKLHRANWIQTFWKLRLPYALPYFFSGLRTAVGLAVIGAIVGEFPPCSNGDPPTLGYQSVYASRQSDLALAFACVCAAAVLAIALFFVVRVLEKFTIGHWHPGGKK